MGELTLCNYCNLKAIKQQAKKTRGKVKVERADMAGFPKNWEETGWGSGYSIFVNGKKVAWLLEITNHCVC